VIELEPWQWAIGAASALLIGFSKTGVPGSGILAVPMMALVFGGRLSVGATLPMLILADCFAVAFYRAHAEWHHLRKLGPYVVLGLAVGFAALYFLGVAKPERDVVSPVIGAIVLAMLGVSLLRGRLGERLVPTSKEGIAVTGALAGFTTMVSNAAGPVMQIYMVATGMQKRELMGTTAWYFFIFNLVKVPLLLALTLMLPSEPVITGGTVVFNFAMFPLIVVGALSGRALLPHIPQKLFNVAILTLTFVAAVRLLLA